MVMTLPFRSPTAASSSSFNNSKKPLTSIVCVPDKFDRKVPSVPFRDHESDDDNSSLGPQRHIEVCVRIRPMSISEKPEPGFFDRRAKQASLQSSPNQRNCNKKISYPSPRRAERTVRSLAQAFDVKSRFRNTRSKSPGAKPKRTSTTTTEDSVVAWDVVGEDTVTQNEQTQRIQGRTHTYTLDHVFGTTATTEGVYVRSVQSLVHAAMEGYHSSILAYGQTSTGKTHTMTGTEQSPGFIPMAIRDCFRYVQAASCERPREYLLRISYLEVYKEQVRDLLAQSPQPIRMFDSAAGLVIKGLHEEIVTCPNQVFEILAKGEARRQMGATHMNQRSSRSHVMVRLWIESRAIVGNLPQQSSSANTVSSSGRPTISPASSFSSSDETRLRRGGAVRVSSLSLVDLAGSESVRLNGSSERREEGHYINKSLMTLGQVVFALSSTDDSDKTKNKRPVLGRNNTPAKSPAPQHIPYRDSKLTRLLQPSLSGKAHVLLLCCISPLASHVEESHNSFKFAMRAKKIPQKPEIQETNNTDKTLLQTYREEIECLKQQLKEAHEMQNTLLSTRNMEQAHAKPAAQVQNNSNLLLVDDSEDVTMILEEEAGLDDEVQELVDAIANLEQLILKSTPDSKEEQQEQDSGEDVAKELDKLLRGKDTPQPQASAASPSPTKQQLPVTTTPIRTSSPPQLEDSAAMTAKLRHIRGLVTSVVRKQHLHKSPSADESSEVSYLRAKLQHQQAVTSLRKADSSFLQSQLEEKDRLLAEVSTLLEEVENRQAQLEQENKRLLRENNRLKQELESKSRT